MDLLKKETTLKNKLSLIPNYLPFCYEEASQPTLCAQNLNHVIKHCPLIIQYFFLIEWDHRYI